jgi:hypothetical protein
MESALYSFYSLVVVYQRLARSFYDTSQLVNENRTRALSTDAVISIYGMRRATIVNKGENNDEVWRTYRTASFYGSLQS